ncbi:MAG: ATP-binding domain-containing protein, partial [Lysobacteraceae bacterium]
FIERQLKQAWNVPESANWYAGRAVMITSNDYATRLFNGDIGLCLADNHGELHVWFETVDADGRPAVRSFIPAMLPAHDSAFAITIHKSQGSEYERVAVLLPPDADNRILSRQLLYTGLSRARRAVEVWSAQASLDAALAQPVHRASGLVARLES